MAGLRSARIVVHVKQPCAAICTAICTAINANDYFNVKCMVSTLRLHGAAWCCIVLVVPYAPRVPLVHPFECLFINPSCVLIVLVPRVCSSCVSSYAPSGLGTLTLARFSLGLHAKAVILSSCHVLAGFACQSCHPVILSSCHPVILSCSGVYHTFPLGTATWCCGRCRGGGRWSRAIRHSRSQQSCSRPQIE